MTTTTTSPPGADEQARPTARRRRLSGRPRRLVLAAHVVAAGAWLGLVAAMLTLGLAARLGGDVPARTVYRLMDLIGGSVIPPVAVATLLTGLLLAVLTPWGLARHWWLAAKSVIGPAVIVTAVTLTDTWLHQALTATTPPPGLGSRLVAASFVHLALLTFAVAISIDKPWGRTPLGRRRPRPRKA